MRALALAVDVKLNYIATSGLTPLALVPADVGLDYYQQIGALGYELDDDTNDPRMIGAYAALAWECWRQFVLLTKAVRVTFHNTDPTPLGEHGGPSYVRLRNEVAQTGELRVYRSQGEHPRLDRLLFPHGDGRETANSIFRAVHDFYGHLASGGLFGWAGETRAYYSHAAMFSPNALPALFSETVLQQCWWAVHHTYAPQKGVYRRPGCPQPPLC